MIKIASLEDILCMKINALIPRGSKKDFFDVYFIMEHLNLKSEEVIALFTQKFGKYDKLIIKKALTYFEDAEKEPEFPLIKKVKWQKVKNFFIKEFAQL
ncbi:MAG: nucleotidyl transferase AbiEii/AbiGii toxin family protein [candidate division WOR-3 bacterium]|nr:nucleotidyl transferase AbiEii/AbiGii toxin family protein [candidate division WOR-3 bacterium]